MEERTQNSIGWSFRQSFTVIRYHNPQEISLFNIDYSKVMLFTRILSFLTVPVMTIIATVFKIVIDVEGD
ncbi:hypothetical protein EHE19_004135 [Ruminiclostridium herbifermentans]|uniref:Uncharacterized protein n=1 Tax=Ruminiclostridium herbifermentans TaxID=2488810 RepID=A0A4U7JDI7_9FIRM|nr:hypothetical protein [Ruminiclostridium herbifermentans]QNU67671.1 hypothetical protein EHE19_004135 [Ruminiclostridium herbifermentans]